MQVRVSCDNLRSYQGVLELKNKEDSLHAWACVSAVGCHQEPKDYIVIHDKQNAKVVLQCYCFY